MGITQDKITLKEKNAFLGWSISTKKIVIITKAGRGFRENVQLSRFLKSIRYLLGKVQAILKILKIEKVSFWLQINFCRKGQTDEKVTGEDCRI